jgi:stage IV sporulation protein FB
VNLSFRLGKIPIRIHPSFLVVAVVFGGLYGDLRVLAAWVAIVFGSVMVHELGHATVGLAFGLAPSIELHGMGGTTSWSSGAALSVAKRIAISVAGPGAGFVVAAIVRYAIGPSAFPPTALGAFVYENLLFVNFGWGVVNLLPMLPLDGGNVMTQVIHAFTGGRGERAARIVSIVVASLAIPVALVARSLWGGLLAASFIAMNVRGLRDATARDHDAPMKPALEQAYAALNAKDGARVLALARPVALASRTAAVRAEALQLVAFGFLLEGRVADADAALAALPEGFKPHPSLVDLRARTAS